jgi:hypothetical protein
MARANYVKHAAKDYPEYEIKKGEPYYWWKFRFGGKHFSKTSPSRSQLTQSGFLSNLYELEDGFSLDREDPASSIEDLKSEIESMKDECEGNLENMPEGLRENSSSGQLLQERIDQLQEWIDNLESIDADVDEELSEEEKEDRLNDIEQEVQDANPGVS